MKITSSRSEEDVADKIEDVFAVQDPTGGYSRVEGSQPSLDVVPSTTQEVVTALAPSPL